MGRLLRGILATLVGLALATSAAVPALGFATNEVVSAGENVAAFVTPAFGKYPKPLLVPMTQEEMRVITNAQSHVESFAIKSPLTARMITWYIEASARNSPTVLLAQKSLRATQSIFESFGVYNAKATSIVIGRTQRYIKEKVNALGCYPDLSRTRGLYLMGASLCNDTVIVMNLTGYLFLTNSTQELTPSLESRPEPRLESMNYLIVDRNISGLSHEWAHSVRTMVSGGVPKVGEPAWMREGFAELMAGMSRVKAFPVRMSYLDFHAIKTHLFTNWPTRCDYSPSNYHARTPTLSDCEYYIGLMGMELLISDFGGLQKLMELCWKANEAIPFEDAFMFVYGLTLAEFEAKAETYIAGIAKIGFISSYVQAPLGFDNA